MQSYSIFIVALLATSNAQVIENPTTFYFPKLAFAPIDADDALYYKLSLCPAGIAGRTQASLQISEPENAVWNTTDHPWIAVQISKCPGSFSASNGCVFAQNYVYSTHEAISTISWEIGSVNATEYYIRAMAGYTPSTFSMELSFTNNLNKTFTFPPTDGKPFVGTEVTSTPALFDQYWTSANLYTVENGHEIKFALAYCDQGQNVNGINVALTTPTYNVNDYSLVQQWACTTATKVEDCTYSNSDWSNPHSASFNIKACDNKPSTPTKNGIWVVVSPGGANLNGENTFLLSASCY